MTFPPHKRRKTKDQTNGELWDDKDDFLDEAALEDIDHMVASSQMPPQSPSTSRLVGRGSQRSQSTGTMNSSKPLVLQPAKFNAPPAQGRLSSNSSFQSSTAFNSSSYDTTKQLKAECQELSKQLKNAQQTNEGQARIFRDNLRQKDHEMIKLRQDLEAASLARSEREKSLEQKSASLQTQLGFKEQELQDVYSRNQQLQKQIQQLHNRKPPAVSPLRPDFHNSFADSSPKKKRRLTLGTRACQTSPIKSKPIKPQRECQLQLKCQPQGSQLLNRLMQPHDNPDHSLRVLLGTHNSWKSVISLLQANSGSSAILDLLPLIQELLDSFLHPPNSENVTASDLSLHPSELSALSALSVLRIITQENTDVCDRLLSPDDSLFNLLIEACSNKVSKISSSALRTAEYLAHQCKADDFLKFECIIVQVTSDLTSDPLSIDCEVLSALTDLLKSLLRCPNLFSKMCTVNDDCLLYSFSRLYHSLPMNFTCTEKTSVSLKLIDFVSTLISSAGISVISANNCNCTASILIAIIILLHHQTQTLDDRPWDVLSRGFFLLHSFATNYSQFQQVRSQVDAEYVQLICTMEQMFKKRSIQDELTLNALQELWDFEQDIGTDEDDEIRLS